MPSKIDGTNGVLQAYDFQTPSTGFSYAFAAGTQTLIMNPAGTLATGTITMPSSPADGMVITIESTQQITALTVQGSGAQSLVGGTMTMRPNQPEAFIYRLANTTWYPFSGATNSQLILATSQASTSGTSIDFTSIPSWVRRITVMFNNVSVSGTSRMLVQIGAGSITSSGYWSVADDGGGATSSTAGFLANQFALATISLSGQMFISTMGSNIWNASLVGVAGSATTTVQRAAGNVTLSGTLDRLRITTVNGTDTFDAGSINIMYE